jgi:tetratricopeptide (TPR) repeat protein
VRIGRRIRRRPVLAASAALLVVLAAAGSWYGLQRGASASRLELDSELRGIASELALSPQGLTAFGGATRRWFESFGMGDHLPPAERTAAPSARSALEHAQALVQDHPHEVQALRLLARVRMDLGDDPAGTRAVIDRLLAEQGAQPEPRDRALLAVQLLLEEKLEDAKSTIAQVGVDSPPALFYRALYQQLQQDYAAAIAAFTAALQDPNLDEELRYFALLHRGWCRTCPEVGELRAAQDDLLQASTLRPNYGTARLLWAGLRCLEPDAASLQAAVQAVTEVLTAVKQEPWVVVLTARVLLQFAEGSTQQAGPVRFSDNLAPLVALPLEPARREALAATALQLLDSVVAARPDLWEPHVHRVAALVLLDRHAEALQEVELLGRMPGMSPALPALLAARVHLAAGRTQQARSRIAAALQADPRYAAAHLLAADLAHHVGDGAGELVALRAAASVLPQQAPALPHLQERIARVLLAVGRPEEAIATLAAPGFGSVLAGAEGPRAAAERAVIRAQAEAARRDGAADLRTALQHAEQQVAIAAPAADQPLHALLTLLAPLYRQLGEPAQADRLQEAGAAGHWDWWLLLSLQQRGWLALTAQQQTERLSAVGPAQHLVPVAEALARLNRGQDGVVAVLGDVCKQAPGDTAAVAALAGELHRTGKDAECVAALQGLQAGPPSLALAPLVEEAANLPAAALDVLLELARTRGADQDNSEARLLQAAALYARGDHRAAADFLQRTQANHAGDLRGRFLLACACLQAGREAEAREALRGADGARLLDRGALPLVQRAAELPVDAAVVGRVAGLL